MMRTLPSLRRTLSGGLLLGVAVLGPVTLAGCSAAPTAEPQPAATAEAKNMAAAATLEQAWAKAGSDMTSAFGVLKNSGTADLILVSATSPAAGSIEIHEMAQTAEGMVMRELSGGLTVPAGGSHELAPGGEHLMLMNMPQPLMAGQEVEVTLTFQDGSSAAVMVSVRDFSGANEEYGDSHDHGEHGTDEHGEHEH